MSYDKKDLSYVPVWIRFPKLDVAYWGESCLRKLGGIIGTVIWVDNATLNFDKLMYLGALVHIKISGVYPNEITFSDENDDLCVQSVVYDWKPVTCQSCNQLGHTQDQCRHVALVPMPID